MVDLQQSSADDCIEDIAKEEEEDRSTALVQNYSHHGDQSHVPLLISESTYVDYGPGKLTYSSNNGTSTRSNSRVKRYKAKVVQGFRSKLCLFGVFEGSGRQPLQALWSCLVFLVWALVVPGLECLVVQCSDCDDAQKQPYQKLVDVSESLVCAISFFCMLQLLRHYSLKELLLLNHVLRNDAPDVQQRYKEELQSAFSLLGKILLPFFVVELVHNILWFVDASVTLPGLNEQYPVLQKIIMCSLLTVSWLYNNSMFLLMCLLFKLTCCLQLLRLEGYYQLLILNRIHDDPDKVEGDDNNNPGASTCPADPAPPVSVILHEHMRLRQQLLVISHRFRLFIVSSLFAITLTQFAMLFQVTASSSIVSFARIGELVVCCALQLIGFSLCLHAAAKITHMAQRIVCIVSQWHAVATCCGDSNDDDGASIDVQCQGRVITEAEQLTATGAANYRRYNGSFKTGSPTADNGMTRPYNDLVLAVADDEPESDLNVSLQLFRSTKDSLNDSYSYRKRHALVTYLQHCSAGISVYGFVLDRGCLYTIFAMELSIVLWTLGKTIILSSS